MRFLLFIYLIFLACPSKKINQQAPEKHNVIILYTDDQSWNTIHALGNKEINTPNLDRLAAMGTSFTRAHVLGGNHGAICAFSRAMLLTGKPFWNIPKSFANPTTGECPFPTMPEVMKENGYKTYFTGKWHNKAPELVAGFDEGKNIFMGGMHFPKVGGHFKPNLYDEIDTSGIFPAEKKIQRNEFSSKLYADAAIDFINQHQTDNPFFIYTSFTSPHDPRTPPPPFDKMYDPAKIKLPPNFLARHPFKMGIENIRDELLLPYPRTEEAVRKEIALYYGMISEVDAEIGRILDALEDKDLLKNTIIVFAGDNGLAVGQHGLLGKQNLYDHSVRVPMIMAGPGIPKNNKATTLCSLHDIYPTISELIGIEKSEHIEGMSLTPAFENPGIALRENILLAYTGTQRALRTNDDWKIILTRYDQLEQLQIFNLKNDPWEKNNLMSVSCDVEQCKLIKSQIQNELLKINDPFYVPQIFYTYELSDEIGDELDFPFASMYVFGNNLTIRYTTDGSEPTANSLEFGNPIEIKENTILKAKTFYNEQAVSPTVSENIPMLKKDFSLFLNNNPSKKYPGHGRFTLHDGQRGSDNFHDKKWLGFQQDDAEISLFFPKEKNIEKINIGYLSNPGSWIFPPKKITVYSLAGKNKQEKKCEWFFARDNYKSVATETSAIKIDCQINKAKRLKIEVENIGVCPYWHDGKGEKAWLFLDEVWVE